MVICARRTVPMLREACPIAAPAGESSEVRRQLERLLIVVSRGTSRHAKLLLGKNKDLAGSILDAMIGALRLSRSATDDPISYH